MPNQTNAEKPSRTSVPINEVIAARWSPRAYNHDSKVDRDQLISLLEAARWAPSCFGDEPWRFIVVDRFSDEAKWQKAMDCLMEGNQVWAKNASTIIIVVASLNFRHNGKPNRWAKYDTGAAAENLCLQATACGLLSHQMGGFRSEQVMESFAIPDDHEPMSVIAIGKPGDPSDLTDELQEKEKADRQRMELGEIAFEGDWGKQITAAQ